jgi:uroporphyrinogen decarboxylase
MQPDFERLLCVLRREEPDIVPFYEHIVDGVVIETILGQPAPRASSRDGKREFMAYLSSFFQRLGFDFVPMEVGLHLFRLNVETSHRSEPLGKDSRGWIDNNRVTFENREEYDEYEWPDPEAAVDYELLEVAADVLPDGMKLVSGVGGGILEHVMWLMGAKHLALLLRRDPGLIWDLFNHVGSLIEAVDKVIAGYDHVGSLKMGDDMGYKHATLVSPSLLRERAFPWHAKIAKVAHDAGKPFILHSCGNLSEIMDDLIDVVKIDAIHSFQDLIYPVTEVKQRWGDRVALLGGVDIDVLTRGTVPDIETYTARTMDACMPGGGWALGTGNSVTNYVKIDNYPTMLDYGRKHGQYG